MTRNEYAAICSLCTNRAFNPKQGVICGITKELPSFEGQCDSFKMDEKEKNHQLNLKTAVDISEGRGTDPGKDILFGSLWFMGGLIATIADFGYIFYGAIIAGAFQLFKGISNSR